MQSTDAKKAIWRQLRNRQVGDYKFRRQVPLGPYIVDFVCFEQRLVVEIGGGQHQAQADYDNERTEWLKSQGFRVLRFWNNEVLGQIGNDDPRFFLSLIPHHPTSPHITPYHDDGFQRFENFLRR